MGRNSSSRRSPTEEIYLESAQGICSALARVLDGSLGGDHAAHAEESLNMLRECLAAQAEQAPPEAPTLFE